MKKKFPGSPDTLSEQPIVRCINSERCETVESEEDINRVSEVTSVLSKLRSHSDNMIRQINASRGTLRIMLPTTAILVVLTVIMHMTIGNGAALKSQEHLTAVPDASYQLSKYESQPYEDSNFNRGSSDIIAVSETTAVTNLETESLTTTASAAETQITETTITETTVNDPAASETIVETTVEVSDFVPVDQTLYLSADKVNLRSEANTSSEVIDVMPLASQLRRTEVSDEWSYVTNANGLSGYLMNKFLSEVKPTPTATPSPTPTPTTVIETAPAAPVQTSPNSAISAEQQQAMVNLAKSFLGVPYQTPCNAPNTFDCSGFTRYIYLTMFNVELPYTTYGQITKGISVNISLADLQIGDIICFDWSKDGSCDHVGLYIGDNQIIDASNNAGKVRQKALNIESSPILSARRIIY